MKKRKAYLANTKRKTDSVCCSTPLSVFHSLLIFS
nr:MAG TPA: hypothetical protein [Caudoviricetes sp.]